MSSTPTFREGEETDLVNPSPLGPPVSSLTESLEPPDPNLGWDVEQVS